MLKKWLKFQSSISIGIDIEVDSIHVVVAEMKSGKFKILHKICATIESDECVYQVLRNSNLMTYVGSATVITGLSDELIIKKNIQLDIALNDVEIEKQVEENAKNIISECYFDFQLVGISASDSSQINIEMVIANKNDVDKLLSKLEKLEYQVNIVDIKSFAIERALGYFSAEEIESFGENFMAALGYSVYLAP